MEMGDPRDVPLVTLGDRMLADRWKPVYVEALLLHVESLRKVGISSGTYRLRAQ
jgi:hypothetical protein